MYPPKKSPYPWEQQIDNGGLGLPGPIGMATGGPDYVGPQNIDPGGLALPRPNQNIDPGGMALPAPTKQYSPEEQAFLRNNPGDEHRMAEALGGTPNYTAPSQPPGGDIIPPGQPPVTSAWSDNPANFNQNPWSRENPNGLVPRSMSQTDLTPFWNNGKLEYPQNWEKEPDADYFNREVKRFIGPGNSNTAASTAMDWSYNQGQGWNFNPGQGGMMNGNRIIGNSPAPLPPPGDTIPGGTPPPINNGASNWTMAPAGRETHWGSGSLDELKTYTGQPNWTDAMTNNIRNVSGNANWGKPMTGWGAPVGNSTGGYQGGGNVGTPPPYTSPSMTPGGNMSTPVTPGITRPTGGVMQPKLPQGSAGGNMNVSPLSGQLPRTGEFQASRKRIPNYVGS